MNRRDSSGRFIESLDFPERLRREGGRIVRARTVRVVRPERRQVTIVTIVTDRPSEQAETPGKRVVSDPPGA